MKTREQIDLALIDDNPWQPRVAMDPEEVEELADSIAALGLLQAPLARRDTIRDRYQLAFGHRRVAAARGFQRRLSPAETGAGLLQPGALPGEAAGRPGGVQKKLAAQRIDRQDDHAIQDLKESLLSAPALAKDPLALALLSATPGMPGWHPLGFHHDDFCFDTVPRATVRALLGMERYDQEQAIETLDAMLPYDLPGLISADGPSSARRRQDRDRFPGNAGAAPRGDVSDDSDIHQMAHQ